MHVVFLTDTQKSGGATIAARRQMQALVDAGAQVTQIVHRREEAEQSWSVEELEDPAFSLPRKIQRRVLSQEFSQSREDAYASAALTRQIERLRPDIVNAHNLHSAARFGWRWHLLAAAQQFAPVVWTLHDEWSFSGRCAYSYDCELFLSGCDARCPTHLEYPALEPRAISPAWQSRRTFFEENPQIVAVAPSHWLAAEAKRGLWRGHRVEVIANCLPLEVFRPQTQRETRKDLGLNNIDGPLLLASATDWNDRRKGGQLLESALSHPLLKNEKITLLTLGTGTFKGSTPVATLSLGMVESQQKMAQAYAAADFVVHPALADNLPNVVLESLACGTPVVALPVGGLLELIGDNTGFLAVEATALSLAQALYKAITMPAEERRTFRTSCREFAQLHFSPAQQANKLLSLFEELIAVRRNITL